MKKYSFINNLVVSIDSEPVEYDFLIEMSSLKDVTPTINILQGSQLDSHYSNFRTIPNSLSFNEAHLKDESNLAFKWMILVHEEKYSNSETSYKLA